MEMMIFLLMIGDYYLIIITIALLILFFKYKKSISRFLQNKLNKKKYKSTKNILKNFLKAFFKSISIYKHHCLFTFVSLLLFVWQNKNP